MLRRHVSRKLSTYLHGELPRPEAEKVAGHLAQCAPCRRELEMIRAGVSLAQSLSPVEAPETLWQEIEQKVEALEHRAWALERGRLRLPPWWRWRRGLIWGMRATMTFALLLVALGAVLFRFVANPAVELRLAKGEATEFEVAACQAHLLRTRGELPLDVESTTAHALHSWVRRHTGLSADVPSELRPAEDGSRFRLVGAKSIQAAGVGAALVAFEVDSRPITLLTARLKDLKNPPQVGESTKRVSFRFDSERGWKVLTWARDGQAYSMVSDLPEYGQQSCMFCHTETWRRQRIRGLRVMD